MGLLDLNVPAASGMLEAADYASLPAASGSGAEYYVRDAERTVIDHTGISRWVPVQYGSLTAAWQINVADSLTDLTGRGFTAVAGAGSVSKSAGGVLTVTGEGTSTYLQCPDHGADIGVVLFKLAGVTSTYQCRFMVQAASYNAWTWLGSSATPSDIKLGDSNATAVGAVLTRAYGTLYGAEFDLRASNEECWLWSPDAEATGRLDDWAWGCGGLVRYSAAGTRGVYFYGAFPGAGAGTVQITEAFCLV